MSDVYIFCYTCDDLKTVIPDGQLETNIKPETICPDCGSELTHTDEEGYESIMAWGDTSREL